MLKTNLTTKLNVFIFILLLSCSVNAQKNKQKVNGFAVTSLNLKIGDTTYDKLEKFYYNFFDSKVRPESIEVIKMKSGRILLTFQSVDTKFAPTVSMELKQYGNYLYIIFDEPIGINNCTKEGDCTRCKTTTEVACGCKDAGESCNLTTTDKIVNSHIYQEILTPNDY